MEVNQSPLGRNERRVDADVKVTGQAVFTGDMYVSGMLHTAFKRSPHAFAKIVRIDTSEASKLPGVKRIVTGEEFPTNLGLYMGDKPVMARGVVRHYGEHVAAVIADTKKQAEAAVNLIKVEYEIKKPILSVSDALQADAELIHPDIMSYATIPAIIPQEGTNVPNLTKIRKGDIDKAFGEAAHTVKSSVSIPIGDHVAMERRAATCRITADGDVHITSSTQAPFVVKSLLGIFFNIPPGKIIVDTPFVGGGFGGKAGLQLEGLAYALSKSVGGRPVMVENSREDDMVTSPGHMGLEATVELAADSQGKLLGLRGEYNYNSGAYADYAVNISRAGAIAGTGPYRVDNVHIDSRCVYTNLPFSTAFRGFGHIEMIFAVERAMSELANKIGLDPYEIRHKNAIQPGDTTPVQSLLGRSTGNLRGCLDLVKNELGDITEVEQVDGKIRAKSIVSFWKAPAMPTNTDAGAILTFNIDGSCNINTGIIEIGQGTKTGLVQLVAETLRVETDMVHVEIGVRTRTSPTDWATAASRALMMAGSAAVEAAQDALDQMYDTAEAVLKVPKRLLDHGGGRIFEKDHPDIGLSFAEIALGYVYPDGNTIKGQIIGRGRYVAHKLTGIDPDTGQGHPDLEWTIGSHGIQVLVDPNTGIFEIERAICAMDVGKVVNPDLARGQVIGSMSMGIGYTIYEGFKFNSRGQITNENLRDHKIMRYGQQPKYDVFFLETPQLDGPYGLRGLGEPGITGMPAAISNALSRALGRPIRHIPFTPEKLAMEDHHE
ncbi:MAG: xanthine dehydrogenase family protein molybdopterin-binding subunit [Tissierellia bacterium]|nr:xanthine dehydrogenase family protein molybdopterin-binding subunit [Tissierellia bacterium]